MRLLFIYGPPAVGKFTIAKNLSKITGYKIFYNNFSVNFVGSIFEFGTKVFYELSSFFRLRMIEEAAKNSIEGLIFTFCYSNPEDDQFMQQVVEKVQKNKGEVFFIHIYCDKNKLFERVQNSTRKKHSKITTTRALRKSLARWNYFLPTTIYKSLSIDNTNLSPKVVASKIIDFYKL